jgi:hypothetical protein
MGSSYNNQQMKIFKQTSNEPYLRHDYKVVFENGREVIFDSYEDVQVTWFQNGGNFLSHIEVLDRKQEAKGFK